mmetsp:Transcript_6370/g.11648  ORF Transcript_6370/g.11648 Transcript_6370/m.11648 type:complete len:186 (-) Transcript_6370:270-827(-)|eukprot:CAMPEP_0201610306 /NCGR_PEP_ID=MMETSP0492-20130828/16514_1 /ASSEMBLY_ACC=CAM_ASM_000837 /TAXON_ID=420259 /ORGANISM="Thalassiosira gravida, Strain GMp14c1" /LENGTH=185 /DNA_ID=CAMNT_0048076099 /DNA_START=41 /DNA_END=598 /DNA_ORIENTATION=-
MIRRALILCVVAIAAIASLPNQVAAFATAPARGSRGALKGAASSPSSRSTSTATSSPTALYAVKKGTKKASAKKKSTKKAAKKKSTDEEVVNFKKAEFVSAISEKTGMTKAESDMALAAVLNVIATEVSDGKRINLPGFGTFKLNFRQARKGRNPATGEEIQIKASFSPSFSASKTFKEMCNPNR